MENIVVAKSREGWGVALGADMVAEFATAPLALNHAHELRAAAAATGLVSEVIDLSEADSGLPLLKR